MKQHKKLRCENKANKELSYRRDNARRRSLHRSRSFKVTDFGAIRKLVYNFILVNNTNLYPIFTVSKLLRIIGHIFTALHGMQSRYSDGNSICLSVRPSVKRVHCDKTEESYV